jgi:hypothetical protein
MLAVAALACASCGRLDFGLRSGGTAADDDDASSDGGRRDGAGSDAAGTGIDGPPDFGSGTITGVGCMGATFPSIGAAYHLGHVEESTELDVYLFASAVRCDEISTQRWDHDVSSDFTGTLEYLAIELASQADGSYTVSYIDPPGAGSAFGTFYESTWPGPSSSESCISAPAPGAGSATVAINGDGSVDGTYSVQIQTGGTLAGMFHAAPCPTGWYGTQE